MITQVAHLCIGTIDLNATRRFYCDGLGLTVAFEFKKEDGTVFGFYLAVGNQTFVEVFQQDSPAGNDSMMRHLCLQTETLDDLIRSLEQHGYEVSEKRLGCDGSWQAWTKDPSGIPIEFHQYTEDSSQLTGDTCVATW